jgi:integrase
MRAPMAFAACTGVRRGEMLSLRWMDVDMANRRLYLRETKNGALRILPISEFALGVLRSLPEGAAGDKVFAGVDASRLSVYTKRVATCVRGCYRTVLGAVTFIGSLALSAQPLGITILHRLSSSRYAGCAPHR